MYENRHMKKRNEIRPVGRPLLFPDRITLPLAAGILDAVDKAVGKDETRVDFIRAAIDRELKRRGRA
jgi:hypothetical protein